MRKAILIGAAIAAVGAGVALAQGPWKGHGGYGYGPRGHDGYYEAGPRGGWGRGGRHGRRGERIERRFEQLDADKDGLVSAEEIAAARAARFKEMDANGDGAVDAREMVDFRMMRRAKRRIERLDQNGDGVLQQDELPARRAFTRFDLNGDGAVSKAEARLAAEHMGPRGRRGRWGRGWDRGGWADEPGRPADGPEPGAPE